MLYLISWILLGIRTKFCADNVPHESSDEEGIYELNCPKMAAYPPYDYGNEHNHGS